MAVSIGTWAYFAPRSWYESFPGPGYALAACAGLAVETVAHHQLVPFSVFELDQPKVLEFKAAVLDEHHATPRCGRRAVAVDLRDDWTTALTAAGFDPKMPRRGSPRDCCRICRVRPKTCYTSGSRRCRRR